MDNANQTIDELTPLKGSAEKSSLPEFDTSKYSNQELPYKFDSSHKSFDEDHRNNLEELINNFLGIQPVNAKEVPYKSQFATSPDGGPMLKTGLSYNDGKFAPKTTPTNIESLGETGEAMSAGNMVTDFMEKLNKIPEIDSNVIQKAFATYQGQTGQKIQVELQAKLQSGIEKIAQECVDGAKAFKLATEISAKVAPILTYAYIAQQFVQGFQNRGVWDGALRAIVAFAESKATMFIFNTVVGIFGAPILETAIGVTLLSLAFEFISEFIFNLLNL